jgi:lipopolysaccharide export system protein LptC
MSDVARQVRSERRSWAQPGSSYDRAVRLALMALPAAIGVLTAFLVLAPMLKGGDVSFLLDKNSVDVASERMRIQAARYRGSDRKGQPFSLNAASAVQKSSAEPIVQLNTLSAQLQLQDGPAQIRANHGRYDMQSDKVALDGPILLTAPNNYSLNTTNALLDLKNKRLASGSAVEGTTTLGTFSGDSLHADLDNRVVSLDGNARLRIDPRRAKGRTR